MTADAIIRIKIDANTGEARVIKRDLDALGKSGDKLDASAKRASASVGNLGTAFKGLIAAIGVQQIIKTADQFTLLEARVKNSTRSLQEFEKSFRALRDVSAQTGASFQSAVEVFQRISFVRDEIGATAAEMVNFTANVQKLGVVSGASTQALNAGLTQLGQGLSSGVLRAEELNSILENVPAIAVSISEEFGVTTGQFRQLVLEGEVLSKDVFAAILNQTKEINKEFDEFPVTVSRAFNNLILQLQSSVNEMDNLTAGSEILIEGLRITGNVLTSLVGLLQGFGNTIKAFFTLVTAGILDAFNEATRAIEATINLAIRGINLLKKDDIASINISSDIDRSSLANAAFAQAQSEIGAAGAGFKKAFEGVSDIFTREQSAVREQSATREVSKNYAEIAERIADAGDKTKETEKETKKLAKTIEKEAGGAVNDLANSIERDLAGAFKDAFSNTEGGFKRLMAGMKASFTDFLGEIAFQASAKPILLRVMAGVTGGAAGSASNPALAALGGGGGGAGGGIGNIGNLLSLGKNALSGLNAPIFSAGSAIGGGINSIGASLGLTNAGFIGPVQPGISTLSSAFTPAAGIAGFGGNLLANAIFGGDRGIGSSIGGIGGGIAGTAIGANLGTILGFAGGPAGALIGAFAGNALGGLFGGNSVPSGAVNVRSGFDNGQFALTRSSSDEATSEAIKGIEQINNAAVESLNAIIVQFGLEGQGTNFRVTASAKRAPGQIRVGVGSNTSGAAENQGVGFRNSADALNFLITETIKQSNFTSSSPLINQVLENTFGTAQELQEALGIAQIIEGFQKAGEASRPLRDALDSLDSQFEDLRTKALALGLPVNELAIAYEKQKDALITGALKPLQDFLDSQALSGQSSLSAVDRLGLARSAFDQNLSSIQGGDFTNLNELTSQASQLLSIGRDVFASGEGFNALESFVRQSVAGVAGDLGADGALNDSITRDIAISNAEQTSILQQVNVEIQQLREENRKLRKSMERIGNAVVTMTS